MFSTMISLIDADRAVHAEVNDALVDVAMAALCAEPETIDHWRVALGRFVEQPVADYLVDACQGGIAQLVPEGGQAIIDFSARLLVVDTVQGDFPRLGMVQSCDESQTLDCWLPYRIPDDWQMVFTTQDWDLIARQRREQVARIGRIDHRQVLYGELCRWLVEQWPQRAAELTDAAQQLQESWLLTPRDDLLGKSPRQVLLEKHRFIEGDVQDQAQNWSLTGRCPPGLPPTSHAFLFGGYGSHEIILYHEMTAHLLLECERRFGVTAAGDPRAMLRHLEQTQQEWLHHPHEALYDQSPAALIARERARLPAVVPPGHASDHDDCPLCRMMQDSGQPLIWQLDNFALDHSFATSFYETYTQWKLAQEAWEEACRRAKSDERRDRTRQAERPESERIWQRSHTNMQFFDDMPPIEACAVMMFSIGGHMAELIYDLAPDKDKAPEEAVALCRQLHETFDDLRIVLREQEDLWMIRAAANAFVEVLQDVTQLRGDLAAKCNDLEDKLDFLCQRYREYVDPYSTSDRSD